MGVKGTPTFFINNRPFQGQSYNYNEFARTFDSLLK